MTDILWRHSSTGQNDLLQLASEVGLVGIGLLLALLSLLFYRAISGIRSLHERDSQRYIAMGGLVGIMFAYDL